VIICKYKVTCSVSGKTHFNDGWFRDLAHFQRVIDQWNAYQGPWKQNYAKAQS